jgi:hypothetical protein
MGVFKGLKGLFGFGKGAPIASVAKEAPALTGTAALFAGQKQVPALPKPGTMEDAIANLSPPGAIANLPKPGKRGFFEGGNRFPKAREILSKGDTQQGMLGFAELIGRASGQAGQPFAEFAAAQRTRLDQKLSEEKALAQRETEQAEMTAHREKTFGLQERIFKERERANKLTEERLQAIETRTAEGQKHGEGISEEQLKLAQSREARITRGQSFNEYIAESQFNLNEFATLNRLGYQEKALQFQDIGLQQAAERLGIAEGQLLLAERAQTSTEEARERRERLGTVQFVKGKGLMRIDSKARDGSNVPSQMLIPAVTAADLPPLVSLGGGEWAMRDPANPANLIPVSGDKDPKVDGARSSALIASQQSASQTMMPMVTDVLFKKIDALRVEDPTDPLINKLETMLRDTKNEGLVLSSAHVVLGNALHIIGQTGEDGPAAVKDLLAVQAAFVEANFQGDLGRVTSLIQGFGLEQPATGGGTPPPSSPTSTPEETQPPEVTFDVGTQKLR